MKFLIHSKKSRSLINQNLIKPKNNGYPGRS
jgi:hypothetical protein